MPGRRLVSLAHEHGTAAVVRDEHGDAWLGDPEPGTMLKDFEPGVQGVAPDVTLTGGLLPPAAVAAVVCDRAGVGHAATCGGGAWLALLPQPVHGDSPLVRFVDAAGELVAVPLPDGVRVEPVADADEPCPVCGEADWGRVVAAPEGRYGADGAGRPTAAVCRRCGHEEALGVLFAAFGGEPPDPAEQAEIESQLRRLRAAATARPARFRPYGLVGHKATRAGHGSQGGQIDSISLDFATGSGRVIVDTDAGEPWETTAGLARQALEGLLSERDDRWPERSETAVLLWLNARSRARAAEAWSAPLGELALPVDGEPTSFALVALGERFAAVARIRDLTITIAGHGSPDGLALEAVAAPTA